MPSELSEEAKERLAEWDKAFLERHGIVEPDEYEYPEEYHCWSCDALKPSWDSACSCDGGFGYRHFAPDE